MDFKSGNRISGTSAERLQIGGQIGGWVELGRAEAGSVVSTITTTGLANNRYYMILSHTFPDDTNNVAKGLRFGNGSIDSSTNYAWRSSRNGLTDVTSASATYIEQDARSGADMHSFAVAYVANLAAEEKLVISHDVNDFGVTGPSNAPDRQETVGKWANTTNVIDQIQTFDFEGTTNYEIGSELVVLGWDPTATHQTNFWEQIGEVDLSDGANVDMSVTFPKRKYLWIQTYIDLSSASSTEVSFNNDSSASYTERYSRNGAADVTKTSDTKLEDSLVDGSQTRPRFYNMFIINVEDKEKLITGTFCNEATAGSGTAPNQGEFAAKWTSTNQQITKMNWNGSTALQTRSKMIVWGAD